MKPKYKNMSVYDMMNEDSSKEPVRLNELFGMNTSDIKSGLRDLLDVSSAVDSIMVQGIDVPTNVTKAHKDMNKAILKFVQQVNRLK